jgi:uncharacterized oxidoreductase
MLSEPRTILLTGGTSGVGLELSRQLHAGGHRLVVLARSGDKLARLQAELADVRIHACDLSDRGSVERVWDRVATEHPDLSVLINNAAIQLTPKFIDDNFDFDGIAHEATVNFLAPAWLSYLALGVFQSHGQRAAIINVSSGLALFPKAGSAVYCATKAALHSLSQSLRYQLAGTRIRVIEALLPLVDTPMTAGRGSGKIPAAQAAAAIISGVARNRNEVFVGKTRWLPLLTRISPAIPRAILRNG